MGKAPQLLLPDSPLMHCKAYSSSKNVFTCGCHAAGPPAHCSGRQGAQFCLRPLKTENKVNQPAPAGCPCFVCVQMCTCVCIPFCLFALHLCSLPPISHLISSIKYAIMHAHPSCIACTSHKDAAITTRVAQIATCHCTSVTLLQCPFFLPLPRLATPVCTHLIE